MTTRRTTLQAAAKLAFALALGQSFAAQAQAPERYPNRPVTFIVPQAAGGANDAIARVLAQKLSEQTGHQFVIENRPGAGGNVGTAAVAKARPDGYTM
ncbi:MAG: putative extracytoplasmic binding receptor, partial [Pseudomonadota bacterium]